LEKTWQQYEPLFAKISNREWEQMSWNS
jgi:hypothetical protein